MFSLNHIMLLRRAKSFLFLLALLLSITAQAATEGWQGNAQVQVRLISAVTGTGTLATLPFALEVKLAPGWHTYWRMPGDAGAPPQFDWPADTNPNLGQIELTFPAPSRTIIAGMETIGYHDHIVFPLSITPKQIGATLPLQAKLTILTCAEQCIPNDFTLNFTLPAGESLPSPEASLIESAKAQVPQTGKLIVNNVAQDAAGTLTFTFHSPTPLHQADAFIETAEGNLFMPPKLFLSADKQSGTLSFMPYSQKARPTSLPFTITLVDTTATGTTHGWDSTATMPPPFGAPIALHTTSTFTPPAPIAIPALINHPIEITDPPSLWLMLWFAFLGGLILNLMPCVLPVLSLKILKFMGHGGKENHDARLSFLLSSAGILSFFWVMAAALLLLRAGGQSIGWGIQFQNPIFLIGLIGLLILFAANLWGWFEIRLPDWLNQKMATTSNCSKHIGEFLTGAFAALLATPCTAPFLGTAIGFALASDDITIFAIFSGMGIGMATPYLLVALFPALATKMPRPGSWMVRLRKILAFALVLAALWFSQTLWEQHYPAERDSRWHAFVPETISQSVQSGHVVFVDITATWCITCQSNKKFVLYVEPVASRLFSGDIVTMQGDWTRPDQTIANYLKSFDRAGIPFNVVYGPAAPHGIVLPELLTTDVLLHALDKAAGKE